MPNQHGSFFDSSGTRPSILQFCKLSFSKGAKSIENLVKKRLLSFFHTESSRYFPVNIFPLAQLLRNNFGAKRKVVHMVEKAGTLITSWNKALYFPSIYQSALLATYLRLYLPPAWAVEVIELEPSFRLCVCKQWRIYKGAPPARAPPYWKVNSRF